MNYYSMLYTSLLSLEKFYKDTYDIVIYYSSPFDLKKYNHYNNSKKYNLFERFPYVKFIETDYRSNGEKVGLDGMHLPFAAFHKWYCLNHICNMGYQNVFFTDCDVIYHDDINILFNKYKPNFNEVYCLRESEQPNIIKVLDESGMNGGQHLINAKTIQKNPDFYYRCIYNYNQLIPKAKAVLDDYTFKCFMNLAEQYAAQVSFNDCGIKLIPFDCSDICYGEGLYEESIIENRLRIKNIKPKILHYFGINGFKFVPFELMTDEMKKQYNQYVVEKANGK